MSITRISRLRGYGIFREFTWTNDLPDFDRYNLIYGWNGTGKTSIGRLLRLFENRTPPTSGEVVVRIGSTDYDGSQFREATHAIRVFNRDFVAASVFPVNGAEVAPIFVIGTENVEKQREVERLKSDRAVILQSIESLRAQKQSADSAHDAYCIERARSIKELLRSSGYNKYNNYDKSRFRADVQAVVARTDSSSLVLSESDNALLRAQAHSTPKPSIASVDYHVPNLELLRDSVARLVRSTVVSDSIDALVSDGVLSAWSQKGLELHEARESSDCLFCGQSLPPGRMEQLRAHFSTEYESLLHQVDAQIQTLELLSESSTELALPHASEFYADLVSDYELAATEARRLASVVQAFTERLIRALREKRGRPFDELILDVHAPPASESTVEALNAVVNAHNQASESFQTRVDEARDRIAMSIVASDLTIHNGLQAAMHAATETISAKVRAHDELTDKITALEREIIEYRRPAEELNSDLQRYLGHGELAFAVQDSGYSITRNGEPAVSLSEGETTAIALLYFLKSLTDRRLALESATVVLDDPVSSLDQNAMFAAFAYIRERTLNAGQLIVMTHNFTFFKLMREWFCNLRGADKRKWRVYMLECMADQRGRHSRIRVIDRLLMEYDSEYHYLFAQLHKLATDPPADSLEAYIGTPSIARRVLETFLAFRVPDKGGQNRLWSQIETIAFEESRRSRIYRFLQTHNHRIAIGEADADLTLLGESRAVLAACGGSALFGRGVHAATAIGVG